MFCSEMESVLMMEHFGDFCSEGLMTWGKQEETLHRAAVMAARSTVGTTHCYSSINTEHSLLWCLI